ncbi:MAG: DUF47 domain-containing protein [Firmicutes bacterium]|nr:DUF47 domain-containing protein [Bacillota bacterium]
MFLSGKDQKFFKLFEDAAYNIRESARALRELVLHGDDLERRAQEIKVLEEKGDGITHEIIHTLNRTFVTPIDREDIHQMAVIMDDIIDGIEAVSARISLYNVQSAGKATEELAELIVVSTDEVVEIIKNLKARSFKQVRTHAVEVNRLENEADRTLREGLVELFANETAPLEIIKRKEIMELMEATTDRCEDVANLAEGVVMKNA